MAQKTRKRAEPANLPREQALRDEIARLLGADVAELQEWNTRVCPDCYKDVELYPTCRVTNLTHLPPLYYALAAVELYDDMPLGMGANAVEALQDLLWQVRAAQIIADLQDA